MQEAPDILFVGFIMAGLAENKRALHDILSGCVVTKRSRDHESL